MTETPYAQIVAPYASALRMIREAIEELFGPAANLESEEAVLLRGPEPHHDAEAIIAALQRLSTRASVSEAAVTDEMVEAALHGAEYVPNNANRTWMRAALSAALASTAETVEPVAWTRQRSLDRLEEHGMLIALTGPGPDDAYDVPLYTRPPARRETWEEAAKVAEEMAAERRRIEASYGFGPETATPAANQYWCEEIAAALRARATEERDDG